MPAPITSTIPLKQCVYGYSEAARQSDSEFLRLWRMCFRGFKQMGLNAFWQPKEYNLLVNQDNMTADIPEDCIQWIKIGRFNWGGEFQTLRVNEELANFHDALPSRFADIAPEIQQSWPYLMGDQWYGSGGDFFNGRYPSGTAFGLGSRMIQYGECKVDWEQRVIILNQFYPYEHVVLKGVSAPQLDGDYEVPMQFEEAMIDWLSWQDTKHVPVNTHVGLNDKNMRARQFKASLDLAKKMYKPFRLQEFAQIAVESVSLGVKP
jgi:hypothetical protein